MIQEIHPLNKILIKINLYKAPPDSLFFKHFDFVFLLGHFSTHEYDFGETDSPLKTL
jgi:hypothetical protein